MVLDKQKSSKDEEYGANYFISNFLGASIITNERDMTKTFVKAAENWTRKNITEDAGKAEEIRTAIDGGYYKEFKEKKLQEWKVK